MYLSEDYKDIIELFNKYEVKYLVVGSYAMSAWGYSRSTYDIDIIVEKSLDNASKILNALNEFGIPYEMNKSDFMSDNSIIQIGVAPLRIDIITDIDGVSFDEIWESKTLHNFKDVSAYIISLEHIIKNKESTNRLKDKVDVVELKKLKKRLN
jgi:hypothetical protein